MSSKKDLTIAEIEKLFVGRKTMQRSNGYPYAMSSLTDFDPPLEPILVEKMADLIIEQTGALQPDIIVSEADRGGGPITHAVALRLNKPYTLANWYPNDISGQIEVKTSVGFSGEGKICLNGLKPGQKAIIVDDLLSTGGTCVALLEALRKAQVKPLGVYFVAEKVNIKGRQRILKRFNVPIYSLVKFKATGEVTERTDA